MTGLLPYASRGVGLQHSLDRGLYWTQRLESRGWQPVAGLINNTITPQLHCPGPAGEGVAPGSFRGWQPTDSQQSLS
ncbi:hypothetical protein GGTG_12909 [Gaeumannomyces tritici R3-111a-1]|uniref:Uncharacterized protein n=1 Tax=Gaeumannomyces tritici (strain R3-111a-1) TaxID=644352 RepID=J3PHD0_GAET3|nr:hypothetical protein GGTG_12909 [Gaeumannomyces tritici R3-111a-1]EJT69290.1 hypothetical protein GGTG_12909 [Gaeumannomyces tritici R3-111a-1]